MSDPLAFKHNFRYVPFDDPIVIEHTRHDWSRYQTEIKGAIHHRTEVDGRVYNLVWPTKLDPDEIDDMDPLMRNMLEADMENRIEAGDA